MSSDRLRTQVQFEGIITNQTPENWNTLTKGYIKNFVFNSSHNVLLGEALMDDCLDFYYKGVISLNESIISIINKNFSWATVKIYYSVYYFLRCSLCCNNIGFVRKERDGYFFLNHLNESPQANGMPDHMAAISLFKRFFLNTDFLQSNNINDSNPYEWLRHQRENVNYRYRTFFEPDIPTIWETISQACDENGIDFWLKKYIADNIYSFLEDHAVLALPIRRLILTHSDLISNGFNQPIRADKKIKLNEMIANYSFLENFQPYY